MTADIELLPCPFCGSQPERDTRFGGYVKCSSPACPIGDPASDEETTWISESSWQHRATAAKDAEIEALRAEVAEWKRVASAQAELHGEAEARAERLSEALRLIAAPKRPDGTWNRDREACRQIAAEAIAAAQENDDA